MPIEKGLNLNTTLSTSADFDVNEENTWMSEPLHIGVTYGHAPHLTHGCMGSVSFHLFTKYV